MRLSLSLRNDLLEIARLSKEIEAFASRCGLPESLLFPLNLALEEIVTNVISYGFEDPGEHAIAVELRFDGAAVTARVEDEGTPYDPLSAPPPDVDAPLEDRPIGGLGVHLSRKLMDEIAYSRRGNRNVLVMRKRVGA